MDKNFNCSQIEVLMSYFAQGKLAPSLIKYIENHINSCPECKKKFEKINNRTQYGNTFYNKKANNENILIGNLSAYIDNELETSENVKIKRMTISNPTARQKLESMYKFQKLIHSAYEKTKNDTKIDYSKNILAMINQQEDYTTTYFRNIIIMFLLLCIAIVCGFLYLYF